MINTTERKNRWGFGSLFEKPLTVWDWVLFLAIGIFCFLSYEMRDLLHNAGCSYGFLDGPILDFYDYLAKSGVAEDGSIGLHAAYLPSVYLVFAVWNIPMKLFGIVSRAGADLNIVALMWAKILPCLAFMASGYVFFLICREIGFSVKKGEAFDVRLSHDACRFLHPVHSRTV